ncbi:MAG: hypothetical protein V5A27_10990 [Halapricum sp.]
MLGKLLSRSGVLLAGLGVSFLIGTALVQVLAILAARVVFPLALGHWRFESAQLG